MQSYPKVSIVVAYYNGIEFIDEQINSLLLQDYPNFEIIIVDDASIDNGYLHLVQKLSCFSNCKLALNETNLGVVPTFERGINLSQGEYIALCDQDDIWFPNKIYELMDHIGDNLLIHSDARLVDANLNLISNSFFHNFKHRIYHYQQYLIENNVTGCTALFHKSLLDALGGAFPIGVTVHDRILSIIASKLNKITYLDKVLMDYRQHPNNQVGAISCSGNTIVYQRHLQDLIALQHCSSFAKDKDLTLAIKYYRVLLREKSLTFCLAHWIYSNFGLAWLIKYLVKLCRN